MMRATPADDRLNRALKAVCAVLIVVAGSHLILQLAAIPRYYQRVTTGTVPVVMLGSEITMSNAIVADAAAFRGMSIPTYAAYSITLSVAIALGFVGVAALILLKARREWFHWFTAFVLLFYPTGELSQFTSVAQLAYTYVTLGALLWPAYLLFLYLFPSGRAVPRWTRWVIGALVCLHFVVQAVLLAEVVFNISDDLVEVGRTVFAVVLAAFPVILACQVYRYVRDATIMERAQIKWFVAGLALIVVLGVVIEAMVGAGAAAFDDLGFVGDVEALTALVIPATIGISILRYRLYDIDLIIRQTLVYGLLTGVLVLVYVGSVVLLQQILRALAGQGNNQLAVVASTLAIAALFQPLRRRIQTGIDRRFYRRKYDAARIVAAFSADLRDEVDLRTLSSNLVAVVAETLQPAHVSLWLRESGPRSREQQAGEHQSQALG